MQTMNLTDALCVAMAQAGEGSETDTVEMDAGEFLALLADIENETNRPA